MQIQLDLLGGLAGDMFIAAVLDAFPEQADALTRMVEALKVPFGRDAAAVRLERFNDGVFSGSRFRVDDGARPARAGISPAHRHDAAPHDAAPRDAAPHDAAPRDAAPHDAAPHDAATHDAAHRHDGHHHHDHDHARHNDHAHENAHYHDHARHHDHVDHNNSDHDHPGQADAGHVRWSDIRARLTSALEPGVRRHALGIFGVLAEAEAEVHGVAVDAVEFHEVGAWDSVVDIVGAAVLIEALDARRWQVGAVPLGSGRIRTAHGPMPVPPPATALLLRGFATVDDGIAGERVTPTGAAILKYLVGATGTASPRPEPRVLRRSGVGFGTRRLDGISNCVRLLAFDDPAATGAAEPAHRELAVVEFEVDDQSAEELAIGLDRLRAHAAIFDVVQAPVFGKKGRMMTSVRLLARPADIDEVLAACFRETTTIGLRHTTVRGKALVRRSDEVVVDGHRVRVKSVERPGGTTAKAESDDALAHETHRARRLIRHEAERLVLQAAAERGAKNDV